MRLKKFASSVILLLILPAAVHSQIFYRTNPSPYPPVRQPPSSADPWPKGAPSGPVMLRPRGQSSPPIPAKFPTLSPAVAAVAEAVGLPAVGAAEGLEKPLEVLQQLHAAMQAKIVDARLEQYVSVSKARQNAWRETRLASNLTEQLAHRVFVFAQDCVKTEARNAYMERVGERASTTLTKIVEDKAASGWKEGAKEGMTEALKEKGGKRELFSAISKSVGNGADALAAADNLKDAVIGVTLIESARIQLKTTEELLKCDSLVDEGSMQELEKRLQHRQEATANRLLEVRRLAAEEAASRYRLSESAKFYKELLQRLGEKPRIDPGWLDFK